MRSYLRVFILILILFFFQDAILPVFLGNFWSVYLLPVFIALLFFKGYPTDLVLFAAFIAGILLNLHTSWALGVMSVFFVGYFLLLNILHGKVYINFIFMLISIFIYFVAFGFLFSMFLASIFSISVSALVSIVLFVLLWFLIPAFS